MGFVFYAASTPSPYRAKHGACALDVRSPTAVNLLVIAQVLNHALAAPSRVRGLRQVQHTNKSRHQEHRSTVVPGPVPIVALQDLEVLHRFIGGLSGTGRAGCCWAGTSPPIPHKVAK